jgi:transposase
MVRSRQRLDINIEELDRLLDRTREGPLSDPEREKLRTALHVLVEKISASTRTTEKTRAIVDQRQPGEAGPNTAPASGKQPPKKGHGRHSAGDYSAAEKVAIPHPELKTGDACPECARGRVYHQHEPKVRVRIVGQAPLAATVFEMERLRCNACGQVFTADEPDDVGADKYDATAVAMIAQLKYGSGVPFARLERLEHELGIPLPAGTQWELLKHKAALMKAAWKQLIWYAAQGEVLHNDDTGMRILRLAREPSDTRTGVFTSGIVSVWRNRKIALFFTGRQHAGENLADVLAQRVDLLNAPIQMCDALSRNTPKLKLGSRILLANCLSHGRRQFVDIATRFPQECGFVLETLGMVYGNDAIAGEQRLDLEQRLRFHQQYSAPLMDQLHQWLQDQLNEGRTEPNSGLGKAISYLLKHWPALTLFLREKGAPLDNNVCERALKKAILNRKNALFYKTLNGAHVGDLFMSLIHTCELNGVNPFDYLTELQRHCSEVERSPAEWMPWNYRDTLARPISPVAA